MKIDIYGGFLFLVIGIGGGALTIYKKCIHQIDGIYDTSFSCIESPSFWVLMIIATIIGTIGAFMCKKSN